MDNIKNDHFGGRAMSRVLIVTGGSRGLGAATCIGAAEQGYEAICVNYVGN